MRTHHQTTGAPRPQQPTVEAFRIVYVEGQPYYSLGTGREEGRFVGVGGELKIEAGATTGLHGRQIDGQLQVYGEI